MGRREFAEQYRENVEPIDFTKYKQQTGRQTSQRRQEMPTRHNYTAKKGTAHRAKNRKRKINMKLAALILAGAIGIGGISLANHHEANRPEPMNMVEIQEAGVNLQRLGLSEETIELFEKYDEYFEEFDENAKYALTEDQVISMINEIDKMHFSTVKEKMGSLIGEDPKNIRMYYHFDKGDGKTYSSIVINEDSYKREVYDNDRNWILPNKNTIPSELASIITQVGDLEDLRDDVRTDRITKINAVKKLEKLYEALEQVATGEFIKDERGNISIIHYEDKNVDKQQDENERDD